MKRLGHSSITVTYNTYGHLFPALDEALTDSLDRSYRGSTASRVAPRLRIGVNEDLNEPLPMLAESTDARQLTLPVRDGRSRSTIGRESGWVVTKTARAR